MRIIAGKKRGHVLISPSGRDTRPTLDRVRESLFGIIQFELAGKKVLDLFAGSGAMGFEALSRYAEYAVFNDSLRECATILRANAEKLGFNDVSTTYQLDFRAAITMCAHVLHRFDIVFLDPPYRAGIYEEAMSALLEANVLNDNCIVVVEHANAQPPETPNGFILRDRRKYGEVGISIFKLNEKELSE